MKNYLFLTKDGFTYDNSQREIHNIQLLGTGKGDNIIEAFKDFKHNESHLLEYNFKDVIAIEYIGDFITNLEL